MAYRVIVIRPATHEEWLDERKKGIGSSEAGTVMGVNHFDTPYKLWRRKTGEVLQADANLLATYNALKQVNAEVKALEKTQTQSGQKKALLDLFVRATQNNQYGNTHFVKANVGKSNREKYDISKDDLGRYSPILGNLRPYAGTARPVADEDDDLPEGEFKGF